MLICVVSTPSLLHVKEIHTAQENYDMKTLEQELEWVDTKAPVLGKLPAVRDSVFWLELNRGNIENVEAELAKDPSDKHQVWLIQRDLSLNQVTEAESKAQNMKKESLQTLAKGLISAYKGEGVIAEETLLSIKDSKLTEAERVLKYTTVARLKMSRNEFGEAGKAINIAKSIKQDYPLVKITEFDNLLFQGHWSRAKEHLEELEIIPGYRDNPVFLIKKALLAMIIGERELFEETKDTLSQLEDGQFYEEYLMGIDAYKLGNFEAAEKHLRNAIDPNVPRPFEEDINHALNLAQKRAEAEVPLVFLKNSY